MFSENKALLALSSLIVVFVGVCVVASGSLMYVSCQIFVE
jgi:hypothetical protein